jgi:uridylate kinase
MDNLFPIVIFNLRQPGILRQLVFGEKVGTIVRGGETC